MGNGFAIHWRNCSLFCTVNIPAKALFEWWTYLYGVHHRFWNRNRIRFSVWRRNWQGFVFVGKGNLFSLSWKSQSIALSGVIEFSTFASSHSNYLKRFIVIYHWSVGQYFQINGLLEMVEGKSYQNYFIQMLEKKMSGKLIHG